MRRTGKTSGIGVQCRNKHTDIAHIRGRSPVTAVTQSSAIEIFQIFRVDGIQFRTSLKGHITAEIVDCDSAAECHCCSFCTTVNDLTGVADGIWSFCPHLQFQFGAVGNDIDRFAAVGNNSVDTHRIFIIKSVALGIDHIQRLPGHGSGIDPVPRPQPAVGGLAGKDDLFHTETVETCRSECVMSGVDEQCRIDIIKDAEFDKFSFAAAVRDLFLPDKFPAIFQFLKLFSGNRDKRQRTGKFLYYRHEGVCRGQHHGDLGMMSAGVGGSGFRIGKGMGRDGQGVKFAHDGDPRAGLAAVDIGAHSGDCQIFPGGKPQFPQFISRQRGGFELLKTGFRITADLFGDCQNFIAAAVDRSDHRRMQFRKFFHNS